MRTYLQRWGPRGPELLPLSGDRVTIGKSESNDLPLRDAAVSHLHAVLDRYPAGWSIRDLTSRNGTFVNGERIWGERPLRAGDEIRIGPVRLVYQDDSPTVTLTEVSGEPPHVSPRERDVLISLCKPVMTGNVFTSPATVRAIADDLGVSESAVKQHLGNLFDKFGIQEHPERRALLANAAISTGAVTLLDLRRPS